LLRPATFLWSKDKNPLLSWYGKRVQPFAQSKSKKAKGVPLFPPFRSEFSGVHHDQSAARLDGLEKEKGTGFRISASREDT
jgi:hypothetical protein